MRVADLQARQLATRAAGIVVIAVLFGLLAYLSVTLTRGDTRIAAVWIPNAFLLAIMLHRGRFDPALTLAALVANSIANLAAGDIISLAIALSAVNSVEVALVSYACLSRSKAGPQITRMRDLLTFCVSAGAIGPGFAAGFAAAILSTPGTFDFGLWFNWWLTDSLGLLIFTPAIWIGLDTLSGRVRPPAASAREWMLVLGVTGLATVLIFSQTMYPLLFVAMPFVLLAVFRLGVLGSAAATIMIAAIALIATQQGVGPMMLVRGDQTDRLHVMQGFLAVGFIMSLPIAVTLTRREAIAAKLRRSEAVNRSILDNMREVIFRTDAKGCWVFLNPAWKTVTGYSVAESLGWETTRLLHPDDLVAAQTIYPDLVSGKINECTLRQRFFRKSGDCAYIEVSVRALRDRNGTFTGTTGNIRDITNDTLAQKAIAERDAQLLLLAENATDAVFRLSLDGRCIYASPSSERLLGLDPRYLVGANMLDRFHPDDSALVEATFAELGSGARDLGIVAYRSEMVRQPGTYRWLEAHLGLVRDPLTLAPLEVIASIRDISATKALEEELRIASVVAQQAVQAKAAFLANMSHEIRTPMNGVIGFTNLLMQSDLTAEQRRQVDLIAESGQAMMRLLNDILDVSKIEAGQMQVVDEPVNLGHLLRGAIRLMEPVSQAKGLYLSLELDPSVPPLMSGDRTRLRQIMLNLIGNAIKFTSEGGVTIRASVISPGEIRIDVEDTGIGIDPAQAEAIFDKFAQGDPSIARRFGGTGLGLSISSQLAGLMGGRIALEHREGGGTIFTVNLPLRVLEAPMVPVAPEAPAVAAVGHGGRRVRVLVAEDHDINQELIMAMMAQAGIEATIAVDGADAIRQVELAQASGAPFELVLMDMQMPQVDGLEATRRLRAAGYGPERLPIIALTANAYAEDIAACKEAGMQDHLSKPVSSVEMLDTLRRFLPTTPSDVPAPGDSAQLGELEQRYQKRKRALFSLIEAVSSADPISDDQCEHAIAELHKFAGVAGMFGDHALGAQAGALENRLRLADSDERSALVRGWLEETASERA
jgi:PAS domain S-box-containing protein